MGRMAGVLLAVAVTAGVPFAAPTSATQDDSRAALVYLDAYAAFLRAASREVPAERASANAFVDQLAGTCPGSLARAPRGGSLSQLVREALYGLAHALAAPVLSDGLAFAARAEGLHWRDRGVERLVRRATERARAAASVRPPAVCADIAHWIASGRRQVPPSTTAFLREVAILNEGASPGGGALEDRIAKALRAHEGPHARARARSVQRAKAHLEHVLQSTVLQLLSRLSTALGLGQGGMPPPPVSPPASLVRAGGPRLAEFKLGERVVVDSGCLACHRIGTAGNRGPGPDLTYVGSRLPARAIERVLVRPTPPMPSFRKLPEAKRRAVATFLSLLRR